MYLSEFYQSGPLLRLLKEPCYGNHFLDKNGELTFINNAGVLKRIRISWFQFIGVNPYVAIGGVFYPPDALFMLLLLNRLEL